MIECFWLECAEQGDGDVENGWEEVFPDQWLGRIEFRLRTTV